MIRIKFIGQDGNVPVPVMCKGCGKPLKKARRQGRDIERCPKCIKKPPR